MTEKSLGDEGERGGTGNMADKMTDEELDKWAAEAMGWELDIVSNAPKSTYWKHGGWFVMWSDKWRPTRNPDQAHMVRREMERQGWDCLFIYDAMTRNYGVMFSKFLPSNSGQTTYSQEECECLTILRAAYAAKQVEREREKMGESEI